jgi:hypothetical protein
MKDTLSSGSDSGRENVDRPAMIHLPKMSATTAPELGVSREVIDIPATADGLANRVGIADVGGEKLHCRQMINCHAGPIEDTNSITTGNKLVDQVTADKSGPAGNEGHIVRHCLSAPHTLDTQ